MTASRHARTALILACLAMAAPIRASATSPVVNATGCLHVNKTGPSATCKTPSSLTVVLENTCKYPIRVQVCLRGADHLWVECADSNSLPPKDTLVGNSCDSDGNYTYWGCAKFTDNSGKCGGDDLVGKATNIEKK